MAGAHAQALLALFVFFVACHSSRKPCVRPTAQFSIFDMSTQVETMLADMSGELAEARSMLAASTSPLALGVSTSK